jgi:hypothetical protein
MFARRMAGGRAGHSTNSREGAGGLRSGAALESPGTTEGSRIPGRGTPDEIKDMKLKLHHNQGRRNETGRQRSPLLALVFGIALAGSVAGQAPPLSGSIFTTTADGLTVNGNIYDDCEAVYLNGGPQNPNAAGLPQGTYYFQVTDPSGGILLSTDPIEARQLVVDESGRVAGVPESGGPYHPEGDFNPANGSTPVQLWPFAATPNPGGEHKVWLTPVGSYLADWESNPEAPANAFGFVPSRSKTDNFKCRRHDGVTESVLGGTKYYDANANGLHDAGETGIAGWRIFLTVQIPGAAGPMPVATVTDATGAWSLLFPVGTAYTVCEDEPVESHWFQSGPIAGTVAGTATAVAIAGSGLCWTGETTAADTYGLDFFNFCIGAGGGKTLGFWSNRNGQATLADGGSVNPELELLRGCNLRNADGSHFDPTSYASLRAWLLNGSATNMACMLSVQLAAMKLNVEAGFVSGDRLLYDVWNDEVISVADLLLAANGQLGAYPDTRAAGADSSQRPLQELLKDLLDDANNNLNFIQPAPCPFSFAED